MRRAGGESCLPAEERGAGLGVCESLRSLTSAAESRSGDKLERTVTSPEGAEKEIVDSPP